MVEAGGGGGGQSLTLNLHVHADKAGDPRGHLLQPRFIDVGTRVKRLDEGHVAEVPKRAWLMATLGQKKY